MRRTVQLFILVASLLVATEPMAGFVSPNPDPANITQVDGTTAAGGENEIWVFPTNSTPTDASNIQWAIDNVASGGRVLLKQYAKNTSLLTVFNFGADNQVWFTRDLTIEGEVTSRVTAGVGVDKGATVYGGQGTFLVGGLPSLPSVTIRNIKFDGATGLTIGFISGKRHNEVSGCSMVNYRQGDVDGILGAFPLIAHTDEGPDVLTGTFNVTDNYIGAPVPVDNLNNLMHFSNGDLVLTISGNIIEDAYWGGVVVWGNMGKTTITNNRITKTKSRTYVEGVAISVGISPAVYFRPNAYNGSTVISGNKIFVSSPNSTGIMLLLYPDSQYTGVSVPPDLSYVVSGNVIALSGANAALACLGACSNTVWEHNVVTGTGQAGIVVTKEIPFWVEALKEGYPSNNNFTGNDLSGFIATSSQLWVDSFAALNRFSNNEYGGTASGANGAVVQGDFNTFVNDNFHGNYPGKFATPPAAAVLLDYSGGSNAYASENNTVAALKNGVVINGAETCTQIIDMNWEKTGATTNVIPGSSRCDRMPFGGLEQIKAGIEKGMCEMSDGSWTSDVYGHSYCSCPSGLVLDTQNRCACPAGTRMDSETGVCSQ